MIEFSKDIDKTAVVKHNVSKFEKNRRENNKRVLDAYTFSNDGTEKPVETNSMISRVVSDDEKTAKPAPVVSESEIAKLDKSKTLGDFKQVDKYNVELTK